MLVQKLQAQTAEGRAKWTAAPDKDDPDTEMMISSFIEKLKIDPANVYFDQLGSLLKKFLRVNAFPKAKRAGTKVLWPTILVISPKGELVESMEGVHPDFLEKLKKYL